MIAALNLSRPVGQDCDYGIGLQSRQNVEFEVSLGYMAICPLPPEIKNKTKLSLHQGEKPSR